jgi:hypothetical protein
MEAKHKSATQNFTHHAHHNGATTQTHHTKSNTPTPAGYANTHTSWQEDANNAPTTTKESARTTYNENISD